MADRRGARSVAVMADQILINLATGLEDTERVTVAFLVGTAAAEQGKEVAMFLTKEAVRLALDGHARAVACDGCPPLERLFAQYQEKGGELLACPICFEARALAREEIVPNARIAGATPMLELVDRHDTVVFSY